MNAAFEKVSIIGLGYVGLPTAATIAARGIQVLGVDVREDVVKRVNSGGTHIIEPDLDIIVHSVVGAGKLRAIIKPEPADAFVIAVPTPASKDHQPDMGAVNSALTSVAPVLARGNLIILESTSPVGTTRQAAELLRHLRPDLSFPDQAPERADVMMAYCPERILPGNTLRELTDNDRLVGGLDQKSAERAHALYSIFVKGQIHLTDAATAEMSKLTENAFRDVNIAFANELSLICEASGLDVWQVIRLANMHPRVNILDPGPGVGGHCIPVDPWFIVDQQPKLARLIRTAREVNTSKQEQIVARIQRTASRFREPRIAVLGLSYKPNVDDLRESPAVAIADELIAAKTGQLFLVEPYLSDPPKRFANKPGVHWCELGEAIHEADIIALLVAHDQFRNLDRRAVTEKILIDTVGLLR